MDARPVLASHVLIAVGRRPNTDDLGLDAAGIATDARGYIRVDDRLETNISGVWALGDCNGRGAFTHTAYNDFEIVAANLLDGENRRVSQRLPGYALYIDPSDFHDFIGVDLYAPGANLYRDAIGSPRPLERDHDKVLTTIETVARIETVLGHDGGQLRSFDWVFSPRRTDGTPVFMFDRESGAIDPAVVAYWRTHFDIGHLIETEWPRLKHHLDGKVHLTVGAADSYYLDGSAHRLEAAFRKVGARGDFASCRTRPTASGTFTGAMATHLRYTRIWRTRCTP